MEMFNKGERESTVLHHHLRSGSFDAAPLSNMTSDIKRIPPVVLLTMAARGNRGIFDNQPPRADCAARKVFFIITHSLSLTRIYILITNAAAVLQINVNALFEPRAARVCENIAVDKCADENRNLHSCASPLLYGNRNAQQSRGDADVDKSFRISRGRK